MTRRRRRAQRPPTKLEAMLADGDLDAGVDEARWDKRLTTLAAFYGWELAYHTHDSRRSGAGFPDRVLVRDVELLFIELKAGPEQRRATLADVAARPPWLQVYGRSVTNEQAAWLEALARVGDAIAWGLSTRVYNDLPKPAVEAHVWRWPDDYETAHARLARGRHRVEPLWAPARAA